MNKQRRKDIDRIIDNIEQVREEMQTVLQEEQDYLDNIPENLQSSERYETAQEAVNALEEAEGIIDDIIEYLMSARDGI